MTLSGTTVTGMAGGDGATVFSANLGASAISAVISSPDITAGTYTVSRDGAPQSATVDSSLIASAGTTRMGGMGGMQGAQGMGADPGAMGGGQGMGGSMPQGGGGMGGQAPGQSA